MDAADRLERALSTGALTALIGGAWLTLGALMFAEKAGAWGAAVLMLALIGIDVIATPSPESS